MSANGDGDGDSGPGRREVAHRLFAAEFDDATVSYAESDEERAPKYVVTPTGARVNRLFAVGVLTEVETVNEDVLRARVVDPTGAFVSYAGQYQPDAAAFFERAETPAFVALTGKARTFEPDDGDRIYTSVRPESVAEVNAGTRDRWTVSAAEVTLRRVAAMDDARSIDATGDDLRAALLDRGYDESLAAGIPIALDRYGTTTAYLDAVRQVALDALEVVAGDRDAVRALDTAPDDEGTTSLGPLPEAVTADRDPATAETESEAADEGSVTRSDATTAEADAEPATTPESATSDATADESTTADEEPATETHAVETTTEAASAEESEAATPAADESSAERSGVEADTEPADSGSALGETDTTDDDLGDFDEDDLYELDEEERREVEESFDVGFESGAEVGEPGEADIDVPGPEELEEGVGAGDEMEADTEAESEDEAGSSAEGDADAGAEDVNLETAAIEVMNELDDGDGADREAVVAAVVDEHGADPGAVADAIEDALMSGRCYEPSEDRLKAI